MPTIDDIEAQFCELRAASRLMIGTAAIYIAHLAHTANPQARHVYLTASDQGPYVSVAPCWLDGIPVWDHTEECEVADMVASWISWEQATWDDLIPGWECRDTRGGHYLINLEDALPGRIPPAPVLATQELLTVARDRVPQVAAAVEAAVINRPTFEVDGTPITALPMFQRGDWTYLINVGVDDLDYPAYGARRGRWIAISEDGVDDRGPAADAPVEAVEQWVTWGL